MELIRAVKAWYPSFHFGCEPKPVECELRLVSANDKRYLMTPFAMLDAFQDDEPERAINGRNYYASAADVQAYLDYEYPNWKAAAPIMDALFTARHHYGELVGAGRVADKIGCTTDEVYQLARGQRRFTLKRVRAAVKALAD